VEYDQSTGGARRPERRLITVLFADLSGYTAMATTLDPEEVHEVVTPVLERLVDIARAAGGTVPQIQGDGFMAVFGVPRAGEDDAAQAVRAGLRIVTATVGDITLPGVHAGVESGEVLVHDHWEESGFKLVGDAAPLAARLCSMAAPGVLLAGPRVYEIARRDMSFGPPARSAVRGLAAPVDIRAALGDAPAQAVDAGAGRLINRHAPRRAMRAAWDEVVRTGRQRVLTVTGDVGLGKTRLAAELARQASSGARPATVVAVRCGVHPPNTPYLPLLRGLLDAVAPDGAAPGEAASGDAGPGGAASGDVTAGLVARLAARAGITDAGLRRALAGLAGLAGHPGATRLPAGDTPGGDVLLRAVAGLAGEAPVLVVVDDADRADPDLRALLDGVRPAPGPPVLWLLLRRPAAGLTADIHLGPLSFEDSRRLLRAELPAGTEDTVDGLARRGAGVPLLLVECARAARDGAVARGAIASPSVLDPAAAVPLTVHGVLAAQLDRLGEDERRVVETLAVTGGVVRPEAFRAMYPGGEAPLGRLVRRGLVRTVRLAGPGDLDCEVGAYELVPLLLGDVAYVSLARADRAARHLAAASWLRAGVEGPIELGDTVAELAYHEERAWRHRRFAPAGMADACVEAGARAAAAYVSLARRLLDVSPRAAGQAAAAGLEIVADGAPAGAPVRAELELRRAQALREAWDLAGALAAASLVPAVLLPADPVPADSVPAVGAAPGVGGPAPAERLLGEATLVRGDCLSWLGRTAEARSVLDDAAARMDATADPVGRARAAQLRAYTWRYSDIGRLAAELEGAHRMFVDAGDGGAAALIAAELAYIATESSQADVEAWSSRAARLADPTDLRLAALLARARGYGLYLRGRWSEAEGLLETARALGAQAGVRAVEVESVRVRAACLASLGRYAEATELLTGVLARDGHASWRRQGSLALLVSAGMALTQRDAPAARAQVTEARRLLVELGSEEDLTDVVTAAAVLACHVGGTPAATAVVSASPVVSAASAASGASAASADEVAETVAALEAAGAALLVVPLLAATARLCLLTDPAGALAPLRAAAERARATGADGHLVAVELCIRQASLLTGSVRSVGPGGPGPDRVTPDAATPEERALEAECEALQALAVGDGRGARAALGRALAAWARHGDSVWHARALLWSADLSARSGDPTVAGPAMTMLVRLSSPLGADDLLAPLRALG
jgi:class 3 adenylate cyclase/tetratricopeptide (TPR) repeat protein